MLTGNTATWSQVLMAPGNTAIIVDTVARLSDEALAGSEAVPFTRTVRELEPSFWPALMKARDAGDMAQVRETTIAAASALFPINGYGEWGKAGKVLRQHACRFLESDCFFTISDDDPLASYKREAVKRWRCNLDLGNFYTSEDRYLDGLKHDIAFLKLVPLIHWMRGNDIPMHVFRWSGMDLSYLDLRGLNFMNTYMHRARLTHTEFDGANLWGAHLMWANLDFASFRGANLVDANLWGTLKNRTDFRGADLTGADLGGIYFGDEDYTWLNMGLSVVCAVCLALGLMPYVFSRILPDTGAWTDSLWWLGGGVATCFALRQSLLSTLPNFKGAKG